MRKRVKIENVRLYHYGSTVYELSIDLIKVLVFLFYYWFLCMVALMSITILNNYLGLVKVLKYKMYLIYAKFIKFYNMNKVKPV